MFNIRALFRRRTIDTPDPQADWIVLGLGNPGPKYANTRHNVGYLAADQLLADSSAQFEPLDSVPALGATMTMGDQQVLVLRSTTFMNLSGQALAPLALRMGIPAERIIVIHDELDLPAGKIRLKKGGNENGHNGLKSCSELLDTRDYLRVRIGISRPPAGMPVPDYVLGAIDEDTEANELAKTLETAAETVRLVVTEGLPKAQNLIHSR
ncbi:aminoacyl-tRNA hydrolase [Corynebacterium alimapuense]|uniref:aminoacyl-tRNA hydrolase n=1 Tax=Corynebacterium alimapuense TaxID=1576874 RepID=UPI001FE718D6|nr:aminoacyl-tRNA hydrolase [Corynebacterium alimapuense]